MRLSAFGCPAAGFRGASRVTFALPSRSSRSKPEHRMRYFDLPPVIEQMLKVSDKISDLNFSVNQPPQVEINGRLTPVQPLVL